MPAKGEQGREPERVPCWPWSGPPSPLWSGSCGSKAALAWERTRYPCLAVWSWQLQSFGERALLKAPSDRGEQSRPVGRLDPLGDAGTQVLPLVSVTLRHQVCLPAERWEREDPGKQEWSPSLLCTVLWKEPGHVTLPGHKGDWAIGPLQVAVGRWSVDIQQFPQVPSGSLQPTPDPLRQAFLPQLIFPHPFWTLHCPPSSACFFMANKVAKHCGLTTPVIPLQSHLLGF